MLSEFVILSVGAAGADESNLLALARVMGIEAETVPVSLSLAGAESVGGKLSGAKLLAMSATTLDQIESQGLAAALLEARVDTPHTSYLVFGYGPNTRHSALVRQFTGGKFTGIDSAPAGGTCRFPRESSAYSKQLAGFEFERKAAGSTFCFNPSQDVSTEVVMEIGERPAFVRTDRAGHAWFHWAAVDGIQDPAARLEEDSFLYRCDRYLPVFITLRTVLPSSCWQNPIKTARIIIDDPLLTRRYGFLKYDDLMESLARVRYGVTTAFIPWNYRRTTATAARWFAGHVPAHSICVHGCDHTNNEFGTTRHDILRRKSELGLSRMKEHQRRVGMPFDDVMVFPQGRFSSVALTSMRAAGFLAAVNSTQVPTDTADGKLTFGEEVLPAIVGGSQPPLFKRRYPKNLAALALDLFLGKPAFIVEHHEWFEKGCGEAERCARFVSEVEPSISWPSLSEQLRRMHLRRTAANGTVHIRFFTPILEFCNSSSSSITFAFSKSEPHPCPVDSVCVNGATVPFIRADDLIRFEYHLNAGQKIMIQVIDCQPPATTEWVPGFKYKALAILRRRLSEFRDNHLARYPRVLSTAKGILRKFRWASAPKRSK